MVSQSEYIDVPPWHKDHFVGGHPAFDFVNTNSHRLDPKSSLDRFNSVEKILSWLVFQKLVSNIQIRQNQLIDYCDLTEYLVTSLKRLRIEVGNIFDAIVVNEEIPASSFSYVVRKSSNKKVKLSIPSGSEIKPICFGLEEIDSNTVTALLALLTLDAVFRLPKDRIRACPKCGWLFIDYSKGGRRKWCNMKACGNREKVSRHYHSHKV